MTVGKGSWSGGGLFAYVLSLSGVPLPLRTTAGRSPTFVFVKVNEARKYFAESVAAFNSRKC
jgi:hypothetical protein